MQHSVALYRSDKLASRTMMGGFQYAQWLDLLHDGHWQCYTPDACDDTTIWTHAAQPHVQYIVVRIF